MSEENNNAAEAYQNLLKKHNDDANAVALKLFGENFEYRNEIRELKKKIPADGVVLLTKEEAALWQAYRDLGVEPDDIKSSLDKIPTLEAENQKLTKRDKLRSVEKLGYDLEVLEDRLSAFPTAELSTKKVKDEKDKTKEVEIPYITLDGKESSLDDFAKTHFPKFLPVLKVNEAQPIKSGNGHDPKPHSLTKDDVLQKEIEAQAASGRYSL